ncbi:MAG: hypothetical protein ACJ76I_15735 [Gaiellaceae bacterium]
MRKALFIIGLLAALVVPAGAVAGKAPTPRVLCGGTCGEPGGGWTGCTQLTAEHSDGIPFVSHVRHYLVVNYCKRYGIITSISIAAHGCDAGGLASCSAGPAWMTSGGAGSGSASFEAHAAWMVTVLPVYNNYDVLTLTVPYG